MTVFVDTATLYALLDGDDHNHVVAAEEWELLLTNNAVHVTNGLVLGETMALLQHRIGLDAVRAFLEDIYPLFRIDWVDGTDFEAGAAGVLSAQRRDLSLADCISFFLMRRLGIRHALAFDRHFSEQGFHCLPPS